MIYIGASSSSDFTFGQFMLGLLFLAVLVLFYFFHKTAKGKGLYGELRVRLKLKRLFKDTAYIFNNYIYVDNDSTNILSEQDIKSTQIDHIVICEKGVLVIETKNYSGRLYGNSSQRYWTQVLAKGKVKNRLYNPIKQNSSHCYYVKKIVGDDIPIRSFIVLVKNNAEYLSSCYNVIGLSELRYRISELPDIMTETQIITAYEKLEANNASGYYSTKEHIQNIEQRSQNDHTCPRCGGSLVFHHGQYGPFLGCDNYPKCKYKRKV